MSTQLFLRNTASDLGGAGQKRLSLDRGATSANKVTNTAAGGTNIQVTDTAGGQALTWFSDPVETITISGGVTVNIRGLESANSANAKAGITVERTDGTGTVLSAILANTDVPTSSSEYSTSDSAKNASFTPTSTVMANGDRVKVTLYVKNQGTMGGSQTVTNSIDGPAAGAAGDTYITFTENLVWAGGYGIVSTIRVDASTPAAAHGTGDQATSSFTAPDNAVLLAFGNTGSSGSGGDNGAAITDSGGLTWTKIGENIPAGNSTDHSVAWWARTTDASSRTVTLSAPTDNTLTKALKVVVLTGVDLATPIGPDKVAGTSGASSAALDQSLRSTRRGSWTWCCAADWTTAGTQAAAAGSTIEDQYDVAGQIGLVVIRDTDKALSVREQTAVATTGAANFSWVVFEVLPAVQMQPNPALHNAAYRM